MTIFEAGPVGLGTGVHAAHVVTPGFFMLKATRAGGQRRPRLMILADHDGGDSRGAEETTSTG